MTSNIRTFSLALCVVGGLALIISPSWIAPHIPREDGLIETLQALMLIVTSIIHFGCASHTGKLAPILKSFGIIALAAAIAEYDSFIINTVGKTSYFAGLTIMLGIALMMLLGNIFGLKQFFSEARNAASSGLLLSGLILNFGFAKIFARSSFWQQALGSEGHADALRLCQQYLQLAATYLILVGATGLCFKLAAKHSRHDF